MDTELLFRMLFVAIFFGTFAVSSYFRRKARQRETIERSEEGKGTMTARALFAIPLYLSFLAYMIRPVWMEWSSLALPILLRWAGVALGLTMLPMIYWVMTSIGDNVSETYLTKERHELIQHGPYRWIRHPLYTTAALGFTALGLIAANWFMLLMSVIGFAAIATLVVPKEEAELKRKFGDDYRDYQSHTGRFVPRLSI